MSNMYGRQVVLPWINKSGGGVIAGDVVIVDTTNDTAFTTTTSGQSQKSVGVVQETIANNATGRVLVAGYAALVNVPASVTRGHYVETHTVAKQATGNSTRRAGSFGQFLTGGTTPTALLWGFPDNSGAAGSTVATDTLWDAAGDLAVGSGADTAARLAKGAAGANLSTYNGTVAWNGGTSFPASPATGDRYWRSDLAMEFYYDGTRWLSTTLFEHVVPAFGTVPLTASVGGSLRGDTPSLRGGSDIYLLNSNLSFNVSGGTALGASHSWSVIVRKLHGATTTNIATHTINSGASSSWRQDIVAINALMNNGTTEFSFDTNITKTGTPGDLYPTLSITYRVVAT